MIDKNQMDAYIQQLNNSVFPELFNRKNKILKIARRNKLILAIMIVPMAFYGTSYVARSIHSNEGLLLVFFIILIISYIFYFTISSVSLVSSNITNNLTSRYKTEIIRNAVYFIDDNLEYSVFYNTADKYFNSSAFFHNKITDKTEDNGITGTKNGISYYISEVKIQEFLQFTFKGLFIIIMLEEENDNDFIIIHKDDKRKIKSSKINKYIKQDSFSNEDYFLFSKGVKLEMSSIEKAIDILHEYYQKTSNRIALSKVSNYIFLTVDLIEDNNFEVLYKSDNKMLEKAKNDLMLIYNTINLTESIIENQIC